MIAQHVAEGGVLGEVGSRSESPGDGTGSHTDSLAPRQGSPFALEPASAGDRVPSAKADSGPNDAGDAGLKARST